MLNQNNLKIGQSERFGLSAGGGTKFCCRKDCGREPSFFKKDSVVHTARCTRPSIGKGFNNEVALLRQLLASALWCRSGEGWFHAPNNLFGLKLGFQPFG